VGQGRAAPHGGESRRLIGPHGGTGRIFGADAELQFDALRSGPLREVDAFCIVRDGAANNVDARCPDLGQDSVLVGDAGAHRVDDIHADNNVLSPRMQRKQQHQSRQCTSNRMEKRILIPSAAISKRLITALAPPSASPCSKSGDEAREINEAGERRDPERGRPVGGIGQRQPAPRLRKSEACR
jgi:hypothetical protein